jgi:protein TonB
MPQVAKPVAPVETPAPPPVASAASAQPVNAAPGLPDREPDYQAAYLNNPIPAYPMAARRMGWQGRVVLNVEVLANGLPGQIKLHQSSGHEVLDNAALQAVRSWRFVPARQGGQVVTQRFLVPIPFILKEAE